MATKTKVRFVNKTARRGVALAIIGLLILCFIAPVAFGEGFVADIYSKKQILYKDENIEIKSSEAFVEWFNEEKQEVSIVIKAAIKNKTRNAYIFRIDHLDLINNAIWTSISYGDSSRCNGDITMVVPGKESIDVEIRIGGTKHGHGLPIECCRDIKSFHIMGIYKEQTDPKSKKLTFKEDSYKFYLNYNCEETEDIKAQYKNGLDIGGYYIWNKQYVENAHGTRCDNFYVDYAD